MYGITPLWSQAYYFKGLVTDQSNRPLSFVRVKLTSNPNVFECGSSGEFGLPSSKNQDSALFYQTGYDTTRVLLQHGKFATILLQADKNAQAEMLAAGRLTNYSRLRQGVSFQEVEEEGARSGESYSEIIENGLLSAADYPSIQVVPNNNQASLSNIRRFIRNGSRVPPNAIRMEELWNYYAPQLAILKEAQTLSFGMASELGTCPWQPDNLLLMLNVKAPRISFDHLPPANLVFLIDNSGSMDERNRLPMLKVGFKKLVEHLRDCDQVSIVTYGGAAGIALALAKGTEKEKIMGVIDSLEAGGSTHGSNGLRLAYELAHHNALPQGVNKVILATDGDFNMGVVDNDELENLILGNRNMGVSLSCLGVGMGNYKDSKIEVMAKMGLGRSAYIDTDEECQRVLVEELTNNLYMVAEAVRFNTTFDPAIVKSYKLIGYDNRKVAIMKGDTTMMEGNLGSNQNAVLLYEVALNEPTVPDNNPIKLGAFYFDYKSSLSQGAWCKDSMPLNLSAKPWEETDAAFRQTTALAWYGKLLRGASISKPLSFGPVLEALATGRDPLPPEFMEFNRLVGETHRIYHPLDVNQSK
jgi:Ca-activated chloride channel family protein